MKHIEVSELMTMLFAGFPQGKPQPETVQVYERMLIDLDYAALKRAVANLLATSRFLPAIAEIRDEATKGAAEPLALEAWGLVVEASRKRSGRVVDRFGVVIDAGHPPSLGPRIDACVRGLGGWSYLLTSDNDVSDRARFCEIYDGLTSRGVVERQTGEAAVIPLLKAAKSD